MPKPAPQYADINGDDEMRDLFAAREAVAEAWEAKAGADGGNDACFAPIAAKVRAGEADGWSVNMCLSAIRKRREIEAVNA